MTLKCLNMGCKDGEVYCRLVISMSGRIALNVRSRRWEQIVRPRLLKRRSSGGSSKTMVLAASPCEMRAVTIVSQRWSAVHCPLVPQLLFCDKKKTDSLGALRPGSLSVHMSTRRPSCLTSLHRIGLKLVRAGWRCGWGGGASLSFFNCSSF